MTPLILTLVGATLAGTALLTQAAAGRIAAALLIAGVGGGLWWTGTAGGTRAMTVSATSATGQPIVSQALVKTADGRRDALAVPFERPIPAELPLGLMLGLGLLAAAAARKDAIGLGLAAGATAMGGWAAATLSGVGGTFSGEQAARDQLTTALPDMGILQFTVPPSWQFDTSGIFYAAAGATGVALLWIALAGRLGEKLRPLAAVGAALAAGACVWQAISIGGFPWRGVEGAMAAAAIGTGAAWMLRRTPALAGAVAGLSLAAALVGLG